MNDLSGSIIVIIGGRSGIGLETAREARASEGRLILSGRVQKRLDAARSDSGALAATLDLADADGLHRFFAGPPAPVDHVRQDDQYRHRAVPVFTVVRLAD